MEIRTRKELKFYLLADMMMNRRVFKYTLRQSLTHILCPDYIMRYLVAMRKCAYYRYKYREACALRSLKSIFFYSCFSYFYSRFWKLGIKLGFSLGYESFGYGLWVPHHGTIVVGENNRFGKYACLHTSICVTATGKQIGDGCFIASGARLTTNLQLGNNVQIASNSVVNKTFLEDNILIVGAPAIKKKVVSPWYDSDAFRWRIDAIEKMKIEMGLDL